MTKHHQNVGSGAAVATGTAGAPEIEVTPEMIEAAQPLLWDEQVMPYEDRDEVLAKIYRAMETARRSAAS